MKKVSLFFFLLVFLNITISAEEPAETVETEAEVVSETASSEATESTDQDAAEINKIKEGSWEASPKNWRNSKLNYDNARYNFANSPKNHLNRPDSPRRINIVNLLGIVVGYAVNKADGGVNYFDNDGERIGYSPDAGRSQFDIDGSATRFRIEAN